MIYSIILDVKSQITMKYTNKTRIIVKNISDTEDLKLQSELMKKIW